MIAKQNFSSSPLKIENRRYIGSKAKLVDWIFEIILNETSGVKTATDIFSGTGVVAKKMISLFDKVIVNDTLLSNFYIYRAFFEKGVFDENKIFSEIKFWNSIDAAKIPDNYFSLNFGTYKSNG